MNQILSVEPPMDKKKRKGNKSSIHSILLVFAIILLIFGIGLTSTGAYAYYKNTSNKSKDQDADLSGTKPVITIERESATVINIVVTHDKEIQNVTYQINDEDEMQISGEGKTEVKKKVELPIGESNIVIKATDINGITASYESSFEAEQKPNILLEQVDSQIQATIESTINIDYVKYYWDDDEENAEQFNINDTKSVTLIDVLEGEHTLNVIATDIEGNEAIKTQKIIGDNKPTLEVTTDGQVFIINASDDEQLTKIEVTLNSQETQTVEIDSTEFSGTIDLEMGENKLTVKVYNKNGLTETARVKYTKE